jgi:hypothetical protein
MPRVGFEPMIPIFQRAKTFHALDRAATVIGKYVLIRALMPYISIIFFSKEYCLRTPNIITLREFHVSLNYMSIHSNNNYTPSNVETRDRHQST